MAHTPLQGSDPPWIGPYRLLARLGAGGMGVVYLGVTQDGRQVAIKVLRPELTGDPEFRQRFGREVATLVRVRGMCTVRVIEADTHSDRPFLVTEYADGPSLSEYISAHGPLDAGMLYGLATGLAEALSAIHAAGVVHRDLKPSNVLLTSTGPRVIDFGIAQALDMTGVTKTGMTVGSAGFMAPEQIMGRVGTAADIFTWAVTIAYAASGQAPFGSGPSDVILYRIMHEEADIAAVPPALHPMVAAALAKDPNERPRADQLLDRLTNTARHPLPGQDTPTQTILAQTWRAPSPQQQQPQPSLSRQQQPPSPGWPSQPATDTGMSGQDRQPRRRGLVVAVAVTLAFVLAAGGTALAFALSGGPGAKHPAAAGATSSTTSATAATATTSPTAAVGPSASASSSSSPTASPSSTPSGSGSATTALPVLIVGSYSGTKPDDIDYSGDSTNVVTGITWSSWTATGATGTGTSDIDSCVPNCATAPSDDVTATITLSDPVDGHFTQMTETRNGTTTSYTYPSAWALSAS